MGGGFLSWFITFAYFKKSKSNKLLCYAAETTRFLDTHLTEFQNLSVRYGDRELRDPIKYILYVWNGGNVTIDHADIASMDPVAFGRSDIEIVEVASPWSTRDSINPKCLIDAEKKKLSLEFEFLDPGEGVGVEFLADREAAAEWWRTNLQAYGTIKGLHRSPISVSPYAAVTGWGSIYISLVGLAFFLVCSVLMFYDAWLSGLAFTSMIKALAGIAFGIIAIGIFAHVVSCFGESSKLNRSLSKAPLRKQNASPVR